MDKPINTDYAKPLCAKPSLENQIVDKLCPKFIQRRDGEDMNDYILRYVKEQNNA